MHNSVNMYASTWICTKTQELERPAPSRAMSALSLDTITPKRNSVEHLEI